jgi:methylated-DNA-[protein]-cysteine S-methyltransferase
MTISAHTLIRDHIPTPIGTMLVLTDSEQRLRALDWEEYEQRTQRLLCLHYPTRQFVIIDGKTPGSVSDALQAYFSGDLSSLAAIPTATGGTRFQREVWEALRRIPLGQTVSYGALARSIGRASAVRAVGLANGANPIGVVVPCHRVIGANASLTGYAGGLARKRWLLHHEGVRFERHMQPAMACAAASGTPD